MMKMAKKMAKTKFMAALFCALLLGSVCSAEIPERPDPPRLVNDFAALFTTSQVHILEQELDAFDDSTSNQIAVVTVNSLDGYEPYEYAQQIGERWGVGSSEFNNGIVILVKPKTEDEDGQVEIQVGYGLEGAIPDIECSHIIEEIMIPSFKENDYFNGVNNACLRLMALASGEIKAARDDSVPSGVAAIFLVLLIFFIFLIIYGSGGSGKKGGGEESPGGNRTVYIGPLWGGGFADGGGSFGGGGFGGFGGGSFGGGGAGGSW
jgi:uncharacterized protein